jgi:hypothetical protein
VAGGRGDAATSAIELTPPASARALEPLTITGRLTLADGAAPGTQRLAVTRTLPDDTTATLAPVTTAPDGTFSVTGTPPVGGTIRYDVAWDGNADYRGSSASMTISVDRRSPTLTLTGPATGEAGRRLRLTGSLTLDGRAPSPPATLAVYRTIYNNRLGGVTDRRPTWSPTAAAASGSTTRHPRAAATSTRSAGTARARTTRPPPSTRSR